ncbi:MAG: ATP-binding cassette domain-containing protein [Actinobacteria bacterium]|uniref:Unannotated protein n=1 Tax=freshwater metagenome TaxID=449393 RepID=A0A6J6MWY7_9ZZZZ|nr:ATP-binding cassette domain-containing protein [Actinomycetota bacterium]
MQIWVNYLDQILIYASLALSLNLLLGYAGQVSVAHAAFGAVGGYTLGYLVTAHNVPMIYCIFIGFGFAFVAGGLIALVAMRLSTEYLILLTLAWGYVLIGVFSTIPALGGSFGIISINSEPHLLSFFGWSMQRPTDWLLPIVILVAVTYSICWRLGESPFGRILKGVREDPVATQSLGKNTFRTQILVFAISSGLAAVAGVFNSGWLGVSTPNVFGFTFSLTIFALVIFGGMANFSGSMLGALVLTSLDPFLRRVVKFDQSKAFLVQVIIYGLLLIFLTRVRPQGLIPEGSTIASILRRKKSEGRTEMGKASETAPTFAVREAVAEVSQVDRHARWEKAEIVLEARGISKSFGGIIAAENLDFVLKRGTITALVGPNGAGKTTVFNLLTGAIAPDTGTVTLLGRDVTGRTLDSSARSGLVRSFQDVRLFQRLSCLDNVLLGVQDQPGEKIRSLFANPRLVTVKEKETHEQAMKWLSFVGMQDFADVPTASLSYGQTKLVSLARVLATEAEVLLLDEPASGIDVKWVDNMLELVLAISAEGRTVCIVEHNLRVVRDLADHSYFMELGRITAEGTVDELTSSPRLAQAYFGTV